ncbi:MAG: hypothetical protein A2075_09295 [Geobacteraceae bacterium GWC2_58_44]|nr:MAG: hypothetical protein A2075_09295 [Geobacteraceae bacterium GWC2_58_44]HBG07708.1 hypothetical protein [Geobacter sp.]
MSMEKLYSVEKSIGGSLKEYRKAKKLTQGDLAKMLNISLAYVSKIEKGSEPSFHIRNQILTIIGGENSTEGIKEKPLENALRRLVDQACDELLSAAKTPKEELELMEDFLAFKRQWMSRREKDET